MKRSTAHRIGFFLELPGHFLCGCLLGLALVAPILLIHIVWQTTGGLDIYERLLIAALAVGISSFIFGYSLLILIVLFRRILFLSSREGIDDLRSPAMIRFVAYHGLLNLADHFFLKLLRGSFLLTLFYRAMGARIGSCTAKNTTKISDCNLIEIGSHCNIGGDVVINGHSAEGNALVRKRVKIGNEVTIGQYTTVLPGAVIEDGVIVGANSLVPKDRVLKRDRTYVGVPARVAGRRDGESPTGKALQVFPRAEAAAQVDGQEDRGLVIGEGDLHKVLLEAYKMRHAGILSLEHFILRIWVTSVGLMVTVILYSVINDQPKLLAALPPLAVLSYALILNVSTAMLHAAYKMYEIEIMFRHARVRGFDWEMRYGGLGYSRAFDLDVALVNISYLGVFVGGFWLTYEGRLIPPGDVFLNYEVKDLVVYTNLFLAIWVLFSIMFFMVKRTRLLRRLAQMKERAERY